MSVDQWVELIKAVGGALGAIIGAVGLAYARIAAKRSKTTVEQTATQQRVDGKLHTVSNATQLDSLVHKVDGLQGAFDDVLGNHLTLAAEVARQPGTGTRRATRPKDHHEAL